MPLHLEDKLRILADAAKYDASCASSGSRRSGKRNGIGSTQSVGICHSYTPDGRCISLLKILLTNFCVYDCHFCINRVSSDIRRARFAPEEVVQLTLDFYRRNYIEGLFLSSGVIQSPDYTMEQLIAVARGLRREHGYRGYIHLKAVPGASEELMSEAGLWCDRLSANVELPSDDDLAELAPEKSMAEIETTMGQIHRRHRQAKAERRESRKAPRFAPAGQSTQLIVGATPSSDRKILTTAAGLYDRHRLRRVYYSAYSPIQRADPRLPGASPPLVREHRLYQADWLVRFYGFSVDEIAPTTFPDLALDHDPKLAWALRHREAFPVDVNTAPRELLLRVPGMGVRSVKRVLSIRRYHRIRLDDLAKIGVVLRRARPFLLTADHNPDAALVDRIDLASRVKPPRQLGLFEAVTSAHSGEV